MNTATMKLESIFNECKDMSKQELFGLLHTFTINRAYKIVDKLCKKLMQSFDDHESIIKVSESYFKMGKHHEALSILAQFLEKDKMTSGEKAKIFFQQAKIMKALGLNSLAYKKITGLILLETEHYKERADLALEEFDFAQALSDYKDYFIKIQNPSVDFELKKTQLNYLKALTYCGEILKAKKLIQEWALKWSEPELKGELFFLLGEVYILEEKFEKALLMFEKSKNLLAPDQHSMLNFEFVSRQGLIHGLLGNREQSGNFLAKSEEILTHHDSLNSKIRLDAYKLQLGMLEKNELFRLLFHPCAQDKVLEFFKFDYNHEIYHFGSFDEARIRIFLSSGEFDYCQAHSVELNEEICLLAKLKIAGDWGLSLKEIKTLFFPHAVHSEEEVMLKIEEMISKLRNLYSLNVYRSNQRVFLEDDCRDVYVETGISDKPRFLDFAQIFELVEVCQYYNVNDSKAESLIKVWTEKEWIDIIGSKESPKYMVK
jgi:tetratricopeptide (TPR) repeat protein